MDDINSVPANRSSGKPIVLVTGIVIGIAFGVCGYWWYQQTHPTTTITTTSTSSTTTPTTTVPLTKNAFPLPELNIQLTLNSDLPDPLYSYDKVNGILNFSTKSLVAAGQSSAIDGRNYCAAAEAPIGSITVLSQSAAEKDVGAADNQVGDFLAHAGGYYFYYHHAQAECGDSETANTLQSVQSNALVAAFKTAETLK